MSTAIIHVWYDITECYFVIADVGPASVMVGNLVQGNRLAEAQGRDIGPMDDEDGTRRVSTTELKII